ncbi:MAG: tyrosine-protein phosphatase, partial [Pygmaiobacter massiliensis]
MSKLICSSQPLPLCGTRNTRDLGGYPAADGAVTKTHRFLRSDGLAALTQPDIEFLLAYGVGCVVDLRSE